MKKRIIVRRILLSVIFLMIIMFVVIHYDSKEYSVNNEQAYMNRICEMKNNGNYYYYLYVWCPSSLLVFLTASVCFSIIQICSSIIWLKCNKTKDSYPPIFPASP